MAETKVPDRETLIRLLILNDYTDAEDADEEIADPESGDRAYWGRLVDSVILPALRVATLSTQDAEVARAAAEKAWWEGVNDQWKHRPIGVRLNEFDNPYRPSMRDESHG